MKFFIKDFFSEYDQICGLLRIWSHLLKKSLMENFISLFSEYLLRLLKVNNKDIKVTSIAAILVPKYNSKHFSATGIR